MKLMTKFTVIYDRATGRLPIFGAILIPFVMFIILAQIIARYGFNRPIFWVPEVSEYAMLYVTFLGAAWVLKHDRHVKMDMILSQLKPRQQYLLNIITSVIGAIICLVVVWFGAKVTWDIYHEGLVYPKYLMPPKFIVLGIVPVGCFLLFIQFLRRAHGYLGNWRGDSG